MVLVKCKISKQKGGFVVLLNPLIASSDQVKQANPPTMHWRDAAPWLETRVGAGASKQPELFT